MVKAGKSLYSLKCVRINFLKKLSRSCSYLMDEMSFVSCRSKNFLNFSQYGWLVLSAF